MDPNPDTTVLHNEAYEPIDSITVGGVVRLCVQAVLAAGGPLVTDADDNAIAQGQTLLATIPLNYIHNGAGWIRQQGGTDNAAAGGANQGTFVAGVARAALAAYADGDVCVPTFDVAGRLMVNMGGIATETDDDAVAAGAAHETTIPLNYGFDGTDWRRFRVKSASAATSDERLMHLSTMAVLALIDTTAPAGTMEIPIAANRNVGAVATETGYYVPTRSSVTGYDASQAAGSRSVPVVARNFDAVADIDKDLIGLLTNSRMAFWNTDINRWEFSEARAAITAQAYGIERLLTDSVVRGDDGATYSAISGRNFDADADVATTLIGLTTNARLGAFNRALNDWSRVWCDTPANASGILATAAVGMYANAVVSGTDNTGAAVLRPVEARNFDAAADVAKTLIGLLTNSRLAAYSAVTTDWNMVYADAVSAVNGLAGTAWPGLYSVSATFGLDNTGGGAGIVRAIEARNFDADADVAAALVGLNTNSRIAAWGRATADWVRAYADLPSAVNNTSPTLMYALYTNSLTVGLDNTAAAVMRPVEARDFDLSADVAKTLIGLTTNSRLATWQGATADWRRVECELFNGITGVSTGAVAGIFVNAGVFGQDNTAAAVIRPVEARNFDVDADVVSTLIGLTTNSRVGIWDVGSAEWRRWDGDLTNVSGRAVADVNAAYVLAVNQGVDSGVSVLRTVEARNFDADADVSKTLIGLLTNSRLSAWSDGLDDWSRVRTETANGTDAKSAATRHLLTQAMLRGYDSSAAGASSASTLIEARNFDAAADVAAALIGLLTNSRLSISDAVGGDWQRWYGDAPSAISGRSASAAGLFAPYTAAIATGLDNTGAAVLRPVEARNFDANADIAGALIGLTTNARSAFYSPADVDWVFWSGSFYTSASNAVAERAYGGYVYQARADEFAAARRGKRFYATHQTPGTLITAQTAFVATTPTFMYRINSAAIRGIIRSFNLSIQNTPGGPVFVCLAIDTTDRYSAGGTAVTLQNSNEESATAAVGLFYTNPTATAAGAGTRYLNTWVIPASVGGNMNIDLGDGVLLGATAATLLIYVWAATTAPDLTFGVDLEEVA